MTSVIQPQEVKLPDTWCALAVNTCELATGARPILGSPSQADH